MQYWHTIYFTPGDSQELFLVNTLRPFLEKQVWNTSGHRGFFRRESTGQDHFISIQLLTDSPSLDANLIRSLQKKGQLHADPAVKEYPEQSLAQRWITEFQHISSRVVLDLISKNSYEYSNARLDILKLKLITLLNAGLDPTEMADYCHRLYQLQLQPSEGAIPAMVLEEEIQQQLPFLQDVLKQFYKEITAPDLSKSTWLRWIRGTEIIAKGLDNELERYLPLLLQLTSNQLGIYPKDDLSSLYILSAVLPELK